MATTRSSSQRVLRKDLGAVLGEPRRGQLDDPHGNGQRNVGVDREEVGHRHLELAVGDGQRGQAVDSSLIRDRTRERDLVEAEDRHDGRRAAVRQHRVARIGRRRRSCCRGRRRCDRGRSRRRGWRRGLRPGRRAGSVGRLAGVSLGRRRRVLVVRLGRRRGSVSGRLSGRRGARRSVGAVVVTTADPRFHQEPAGGEDRQDPHYGRNDSDWGATPRTVVVLVVHFHDLPDPREGAGIHKPARQSTIVARWGATERHARPAPRRTCATRCADRGPATSCRRRRGRGACTRRTSCWSGQRPATSP